MLCLALLVYCLVELRKSAGDDALATKLDRLLYAGRPAIPTAGLIFTALAALWLRTATSDGTPGSGEETDALQLRLLDLLQIDPRRTR